MSDTKLRDLEHRWKETGTVEDEAAFLLERVRVGDFTREKLELAAYCGHEGAALVLRPRAPTPPAQAIGWVLGLKRWNDNFVVRVHVRLAEECVARWEAVVDDPAPAVLARAARTWSRCPCAALPMT